MLIDTHCHLEWESYSSELDQVLERARAAGVGSIVTIGTDAASLVSSRVLVTRFDPVYRCIGFHPDCVLQDGFNLESIGTMMKLLDAEVEYPKTVGVGECGLDYYVIERNETISSARKEELRDLQRELFERQILFAIQHELPLSLHVRDDREDAYADVVEILSEYFGADSDFSMREFSFSLKSLVDSQPSDFVKQSGDRVIPGVLHCVSGSADYVDACREMGFVVSFAGNVTYKNADLIAEHARRIPLDEIVVETDGPFLSPVPYRGSRNESAYVVETAKKIAEIKGISFEEVCDATTDTAKRLFRL